MYKLIAIDADGTLLNNDLTISMENKRAIAHAKDKGAMIALCSGRSYASLKTFAKDVGLGAGDYIIAFNGGVIYKLDETFAAVDDDEDEDKGGHRGAYKYEMPLCEHTFDADTAKLIISEIRNAKAKQSPSTRELTGFVIYDHVFSVLAEEGEPQAERYAQKAWVSVVKAKDVLKAINGKVYKILMSGEHRALLQIEEHMKNVTIPGMDMVFSAPSLLEFLRTNAQKGIGLEFLARELGIDMADSMAIGNEANDISMINAAGMGVAVANSIDELKSAADYVTVADNEHSGVAEAIFRFIV